MKIHLIGIGGISMRGLAVYLREQGHIVTGCDLVPFNLPSIPIALGHDPSHLNGGVDQLIINSAIGDRSPGWPEVLAAKERGIPVVKRAVAIGAITRERPTIAVSGTHGKSTTTGMIAAVCVAANLDPFVLIGATVPAFAGATYRAGRGPVVLEADEFDRSFLHFSCDTAVITNIDADHLDYYTGGLPEIVTAFANFARNLKPKGKAIVWGDDSRIDQALVQSGLGEDRTISFGRRAGATYQVIDQGSEDGLNRFQIIGPMATVECQLKVPGQHNQLNAAATLAVADQLKIPLRITQETLAAYRGLGRRFEILTDSAQLTVISDYAHHPREVRETITATRSFYPRRRLVVIFQPHQYARTYHFLADFRAALSQADRVIVTDIFAVVGREEEQLVTASDLAAAVQCGDDSPGQYFPKLELVDRLPALVHPGDVLLFMGAGGDIDRLARETVQYLVPASLD